MNRTVKIVLVVACGVFALTAALGVGEARLLADRGEMMTVLTAEDGTRWVQTGEQLVPASASASTATSVLADPANPSLHATSPLAHATSAALWPALGAAALAAAAVGLNVLGRRRGELDEAPDNVLVLDGHRGPAMAG